MPLIAAAAKPRRRSAPARTRSPEAPARQTHGRLFEPVTRPAPGQCEETLPGTASGDGGRYSADRWNRGGPSGLTSRCFGGHGSGSADLSRSQSALSVLASRRT